MAFRKEGRARPGQTCPRERRRRLSRFPKSSRARRRREVVPHRELRPLRARRDAEGAKRYRHPDRPPGGKDCRARPRRDGRVFQGNSKRRRPAAHAFRRPVDRGLRGRDHRRGACAGPVASGMDRCGRGPVVPLRPAEEELALYERLGRGERVGEIRVWLARARVWALKLVCARLGGLGIRWALVGSSGLALRGVDVEPHDIDILTDEGGAYGIDRLLSEFSPSARSRSPRPPGSGRTSGS